jgi:hypothetical protein
MGRFLQYIARMEPETFMIGAKSAGATAAAALFRG